jgi:hypothetical protein
MTILNHRFDRFSATDSSMSHAGALLTGYIMTVIDGAQGFAIGTLSGTSTKNVNVKLRDVTTKEIADYIVSLNGKGIWVFRPTPGPLPESGSNTPIQIYGYEENAAELDRLTCGGNPK